MKSPPEPPTKIGAGAGAGAGVGAGVGAGASVVDPSKMKSSALSASTSSRLLKVTA